MKTRNGFVSNSSSSSFILFGNPIDVADIKIKDIEEGRIVASGTYLGEGYDLFVLSPEIFEIIGAGNNPKLDEELAYYFTYFLVEEGTSLDLREVPQECRVYSMNASYHSSDTLKRFKENYDIPELVS